jgi:SAM-dependent methyltransferase
VDLVALSGVDVVARLEALPFAPQTIGQAQALDVLEHLDDLPHAMKQIHDALVPGGRMLVEVPYFANVNAFADPTHRRWFTYTTFDHFTAPPGRGWQANRHTWFSAARFRIVRRRLRFGRLHRAIGAQWLANRFPAVYENLFAYWFPARALEVDLVKVEEPLTTPVDAAPPCSPRVCSS